MARGERNRVSTGGFPWWRVIQGIHATTEVGAGVAFDEREAQSVATPQSAAPTSSSKGAIYNAEFGRSVRAVGDKGEITMGTLGWTCARSCQLGGRGERRDTR